MAIRSHLWVNTDKRLIIVLISFELRKEFRQRGCHIRQTEKGTGGSIIWYGRCWEEQSLPLLFLSYSKRQSYYSNLKKKWRSLCFVIVVGCWHKWICIYRRGNGWQDWMKGFFFIIHFNAVWEAEEVAYIEIIRSLFFKFWVREKRKHNSW